MARWRRNRSGSTFPSLVQWRAGMGRSPLQVPFRSACLRPFPRNESTLKKKRAPRVLPRRALIRRSEPPRAIVCRWLVRRAFGDEDELNSAIFLLRALLRRGLTNARGAARSINALLSEVGLGQVSAAL